MCPARATPIHLARRGTSATANANAVGGMCINVWVHTISISFVVLSGVLYFYTNEIHVSHMMHQALNLLTCRTVYIENAKYMRGGPHSYLANSPGSA